MKQIELTNKQEAKREKIEARVQKFNEACIKLFKRELVEGDVIVSQSRISKESGKANRYYVDCLKCVEGTIELQTRGADENNNPYSDDVLKTLPYHNFRDLFSKTQLTYFKFKLA